MITAPAYTMRDLGIIQEIHGDEALITMEDRRKFKVGKAEWDQSNPRPFKLGMRVKFLNEVFTIL